MKIVLALATILASALIVPLLLLDWLVGPRRARWQAWDASRHQVARLNAMLREMQR